MRLTKTLKSFLLVGGLALAGLLTTALALAAVLNSPEKENISQSGTDAGYPAIAVTGANGQYVGIVWAERYSGGGAVQGPIYFKGTKDGRNLSIKTVVDNSTSQADQSWSPDVASDPISPTLMHVVWRNLQGSTERIYYAQCTIGSICSARQEIASGTGLKDPKISANASGAGLHVVWQSTTDNRIYYRGRNGSGTWISPIAISNSAPAEASHPAMAVSSASGSIRYVHVVWAADTNGDGTNDAIHYRRGTVGVDGVVGSWDLIKDTLPTKPFGTNNPDYPTVAAITGTVAFFWDAEDTTISDDDQYYALYLVSHDDGGSFSSAAMNIIDDHTSTFTQRLSDNDPGTGANDLTEHSERLQLRSTFQVTSTAGITGILHLVWHQTVYTNTPAEGDVYNHDVFYSSRKFGTSCPGGCIWSPATNETISDKFTPSSQWAYSMSPDIGVGQNGRIHVVYMEGKQNQEFRLENTIFDIIYQGTCEGTVPGQCGLKDNNPKVFLPIILKNS
jgi:hypothetical protein